MSAEQSPELLHIGIVGGGSMKPRMTKRVMAGLAQLAGFVEAGSSEEVVGYSEDQLARMPEERRGWENVVRACEWIRAMQQHWEGQP